MPRARYNGCIPVQRVRCVCRTAPVPNRDDGARRARLVSGARTLLAAVSLAGLPLAAAAQGLPSAPVTLVDGRLVVGGSVSVSVGPSDDLAYYNLTTYDASLLRMLQATLNAAFRLGERADVVADLNGQTSLDEWHWRFYAPSLYASVRPLRGRSIALRGGILRPAFGAFLERRYGVGNDLIGYPLAYHYATSVRADAFPASASELLGRRGLGAVARYTIGDPARAPGLPLVDPLGWTPGVGVSAGGRGLNIAAALTRGGIASGRSRDTTTGWQASGRLRAQLVPSLAIGGSAAYGAYVRSDERALVSTASANERPRETALGIDAEYSRGYWIVRAEMILSRRTVPAFEVPYLSEPLWARWTGVEARYKLRPGLYLAARAERLSFNRVTAGTERETWDANVTRLEAGGGYSLTRNITGKLTYQWNQRDSGWYPRQQLVSAQAVLWF